MESTNRIVLSMLGLLTAYTVTGQENETALARVNYEFTHINDTLQPDKPHKEEMVLYIGQGTSLYGTYSSERVNQQIKKQMDDPAFDGNLTITGSGRTTRESYYVQTAEQVLKQLLSLAGDRYVVDEEYPIIDWQIVDEAKDIDGYLAQRAEGSFKGRHYTAWFTDDLPFQVGPWKLMGLPGLILEATDSREEVIFRFAGFETLAEGEAVVSVPENAIATNKQALMKLEEAYRKNPQAVHSAKASAGGGGSGTGFSIGGSNMGIEPSRIKSISVKRDDSQVSSETNNPLELTEK